MIAITPKSKAIKSYIFILSNVLKKKFGKHKQYSIDQINESVALAKLNEKYIHYAYATYMSKKSFEALNLENKKDFQKLRIEVSKKFFKGNVAFNIHDILSKSKVHFKIKGDELFSPEKMSMAENGDPMQDHFDSD